MAAGAAAAASARPASVYIKDLSDWGPTVPNRKPFKDWFEDALIWAELQLDRGMTSRQCCLTLMRSLIGESRKIAQRVPLTIQQDGGIADLADGQGPIQRTGIMIVLHVLRRKYDKMDVVREAEAQQKYEVIRRKPGQSIDSYITEFELARDEAQEAGLVIMNIKGHVQKLLRTAGYPRDSWMDLFRENDGRIPETEAQYADLLGRLRYLSTHLINFDPGLRSGGTYHGEEVHQSFPTFSANAWNVSSPSASANVPPPPVPSYPMYDSRWPSTAGGACAAGTLSSSWNAGWNGQDQWTEQAWLGVGAEDEDSSASEDDDEPPPTFQDLDGLDANVAYETAYLQYRHGKRRWRYLSGTRTKKGRGKGFGRKHFRSTYVMSPVEFEVYFKGKGKGKKSSNLNPLGPDGKPLTCSVPGCGSIHHFRRNCPLNKGKGKGGQFLTLQNDGMTTGTWTIFEDTDLDVLMDLDVNGATPDAADAHLALNTSDNHNDLYNHNANDHNNNHDNYNDNDNHNNLRAPVLLAGPMPTLAVAQLDPRRSLEPSVLEDTSLTTTTTTTTTYNNQHNVGFRQSLVPYGTRLAPCLWQARVRRLEDRCPARCRVCQGQCMRVPEHVDRGTLHTFEHASDCALRPGTTTFNDDDHNHGDNDNGFAAYPVISEVNDDDEEADPTTSAPDTTARPTTTSAYDSEGNLVVNMKPGMGYLSWRTWLGNPKMLREQRPKTDEKDSGADSEAFTAGVASSSTQAPDPWQYGGDPWSSSTSWTSGLAKTASDFAARFIREKGEPSQDAASSTTPESPEEASSTPEHFFIGEGEAPAKDFEDDPVITTEEVTNSDGTLDIDLLVNRINGFTLRSTPQNMTANLDVGHQMSKVMEQEPDYDEDRLVYHDCESDSEVLDRLVTTSALSKFKGSLRLEETAETYQPKLSNGMPSEVLDTVATSTQHLRPLQLLQVDPYGEIKFFPIFSSYRLLNEASRFDINTHRDPSQHYHANTRLSERRDGPLVDCGAIGDLGGEERVMAMAALAEAKTGLKTIFRPMQGIMRVEGVGNGTQTANYEALIPIILPNGQLGRYVTPYIKNSSIPLLLGLRTLVQRRTLLDLHSKKMYWVGAGGYTLKLSPGSQCFDLESAPSGHLILPTTDWEKLGGPIDADTKNKIDNLCGPHGIQLIDQTSDSFAATSTPITAPPSAL